MPIGIVRAADRVAVWHSAAEETEKDPFEGLSDPASAPTQPPAGVAPAPQQLGYPNSNKFKTPANGLKKIMDTAPHPVPGTGWHPPTNQAVQEWGSKYPDFVKSYLKPDHQDSIKNFIGEDNHAKFLHHAPTPFINALTQHAQKPAPNSKKYFTPTNQLKKVLEDPNTQTTHVQEVLKKYPALSTYMHPQYADALKGTLGEKNYAELQKHLTSPEKAQEGTGPTQTTVQNDDQQGLSPQDVYQGFEQVEHDTPEDKAFQTWFGQTTGMDEEQAKAEFAKMGPQGVANWSPGGHYYEQYAQPQDADEIDQIKSQMPQQPGQGLTPEILDKHWEGAGGPAWQQGWVSKHDKDPEGTQATIKNLAEKGLTAGGGNIGSDAQAKWKKVYDDAYGPQQQAPQDEHYNAILQNGDGLGDEHEQTLASPEFKQWFDQHDYASKANLAADPAQALDWFNTDQYDGNEDDDYEMDDGSLDHLKPSPDDDWDQQLLAQPQQPLGDKLKAIHPDFSDSMVHQLNENPNDWKDLLYEAAKNQTHHLWQGPKGDALRKALEEHYGEPIGGGASPNLLSPEAQEHLDKLKGLQPGSTAHAILNSPGFEKWYGQEYMGNWPSLSPMALINTYKKSNPNWHEDAYKSQDDDQSEIDQIQNLLNSPNPPAGSGDADQHAALVQGIKQIFPNADIDNMSVPELKGQLEAWQKYLDHPDLANQVSQINDLHSQHFGADGWAGPTSGPLSTQDVLNEWAKLTGGDPVHSDFAKAHKNSTPEQVAQQLKTLGFPPLQSLADKVLGQSAPNPHSAADFLEAIKNAYGETAAQSWSNSTPEQHASYLHGIALGGGENGNAAKILQQEFADYLGGGEAPNPHLQNLIQNGKSGFNAEAQATFASPEFKQWFDGLSDTIQGGFASQPGLALSYFQDHQSQQAPGANWDPHSFAKEWAQATGMPELWDKVHNGDGHPYAEKSYEDAKAAAEKSLASNMAQGSPTWIKKKQIFDKHFGGGQQAPATVQGKDIADFLVGEHGWTGQSVGIQKLQDATSPEEAKALLEKWVNSSHSIGTKAEAQAALDKFFPAGGQSEPQGDPNAHLDAHFLNWMNQEYGLTAPQVDDIAKHSGPGGKYENHGSIESYLTDYNSDNGKDLKWAPAQPAQSAPAPATSHQPLNLSQDTLGGNMPAYMLENDGNTKPYKLAPGVDAFAQENGLYENSPSHQWFNLADKWSNLSEEEKEQYAAQEQGQGAQQPQGLDKSVNPLTSDILKQIGVNETIGGGLTGQSPEKFWTNVDYVKNHPADFGPDTSWGKIVNWIDQGGASGAGQATGQISPYYEKMVDLADHLGSGIKHDIIKTPAFKEWIHKQDPSTLDKWTEGETYLAFKWGDPQGTSNDYTKDYEKAYGEKQQGIKADTTTGVSGQGGGKQPLTQEQWLNFSSGAHAPSDAKKLFSILQTKDHDGQIALLTTWAKQGGGWIPDAAKKALQVMQGGGTPPAKTFSMDQMDALKADAEQFYGGKALGNVLGGYFTPEDLKKQLEHYAGQGDGNLSQACKKLLDKYFGAGGQQQGFGMSQHQALLDDAESHYGGKGLLWDKLKNSTSPEEIKKNLDKFSDPQYGYSSSTANTAKEMLKKYFPDGIQSDDLSAIQDQMDEVPPEPAKPFKGEELNPEDLTQWAQNKPQDAADWKNFSTWWGNTKLAPEQEQALYNGWFGKDATPEQAQDWFQQVFEHNSAPSEGDLGVTHTPSWAHNSWAFGDKADAEWPVFQQWAAKHPGIPKGTSIKQKVAIWNSLSDQDKADIESEYLPTTQIDTKSVIKDLQAAFPDSNWSKWKGMTQTQLQKNVENLAKSGYGGAIPVFNKYFGGDLPVPEASPEAATPEGGNEQQPLPPPESLPPWMQQQLEGKDPGVAEKLTKEFLGLANFAKSVGEQESVLGESKPNVLGKAWNNIPAHLKAQMAQMDNPPWHDLDSFKQWQEQQPTAKDAVKALVPGAYLNYHWDHDTPGYDQSKQAQLGELIKKADPATQQQLLAVQSQFFGHGKTTMAEGLKEIYPDQDWDKLLQKKPQAGATLLKKQLKTETDPVKWAQLASLWGKHMTHPTKYNSVAPSGIKALTDYFKYKSPGSGGDLEQLAKHKLADPEGTSNYFKGNYSYQANELSPEQKQAIDNLKASQSGKSYLPYLGWTPPSSQSGTFKGFTPDPAVMIKPENMGATYTAFPEQAATGHYKNLLDVAKKSSGYSDKDREVLKSESFRNWFTKAPKGYQQKYEGHPGTPLDDFTDFMKGNKAYSESPEAFHGTPKTIDTSPQALLPKWDKNKTKIPEHQVVTKGRQDSSGEADQIKHPEYQDEQETLPLGPGEKWAPKKAPMPLYRLMRLKLDEEPSAPNWVKGNKARELHIQQQKSRLRRIDEIVNGTNKGRKLVHDQDDFQNFANRHHLSDQDKDQLALTLFAPDSSHQPDMFAGSDDKWDALSDFAKKHNINYDEIAGLAKKMEVAAPPESKGNFDHPDLAGLILDYFENGGGAGGSGIGTHWTRDKDKAYHGFPESGGVFGPEKMRSTYRQIPVLMHGLWHGQGETTSGEGGAYNLMDDRERETNLKSNAPVWVHRMQIRGPEGSEGELREDWHDIMDHTPASLLPPGRDETASQSSYGTNPHGKTPSRLVTDKPSLAQALQDNLGGGARQNESQWSYSKKDWDHLTPGHKADQMFNDLVGKLGPHPEKTHPKELARIRKIYQEFFVGRPEMPTKPHHRRASLQPIPKLARFNDYEYRHHVTALDRALEQSFAEKKDTRHVHGIVGADGVTRWGPKRLAQQKRAVDRAWKELGGDNIPQEGLAMLLAGVSGSGKGDLYSHPMLGLHNYLRIDPDHMKHIMAQEGMIPTMSGFSPMESSPLAHHEASELVTRLAQRAYRQKRNVVWDTTMGNQQATDDTIDALRGAGYNRVDGALMSTHPNTARKRTESRHRQDEDDWRDGIGEGGQGGRWVPTGVSRRSAKPDPASGHRTMSEQVFANTKHKFDNAAEFNGDSTPSSFVGASGPHWGTEQSPPAPATPAPVPALTTAAAPPHTVRSLMDSHERGELPFERLVGALAQAPYTQHPQSRDLAESYHHAAQPPDDNHFFWVDSAHDRGVINDAQRQTITDAIDHHHSQTKMATTSPHLDERNPAHLHELAKSWGVTNPERYGLPMRVQRLKRDLEDLKGVAWHTTQIVKQHGFGKERKVGAWGSVLDTLPDHIKKPHWLSDYDGYGQVPGEVQDHWQDFLKRLDDDEIEKYSDPDVYGSSGKTENYSDDYENAWNDYLEANGVKPSWDYEDDDDEDPWGHPSEDDDDDDFNDYDPDDFEGTPPLPEGDRPVGWPTRAPWVKGQDKQYFPPNGLNPESDAHSRPYTDWEEANHEQDPLPLSSDKSNIQLWDDWPHDREPMPLYRGFNLSLNGKPGAQGRDDPLGWLRRSLWGGEYEPDTGGALSNKEIAKAHPLGFDNPDIGPRILDHIQNNKVRPNSSGHGVGRHWTADEDTAHQFALQGTGNGTDPLQIPVKIRAQWKGLGEDPYRSNTGGHYPEEHELTMTKGAPMHIDSVQIRHPHTGDWHEVLSPDDNGPPQAATHEAAIEANEIRILMAAEITPDPHNKHTWLAHEGDDEVGRLAVEPDPEGDWIADLRVHPDHQRKGIGRQLWESAGRPAHTPDTWTPEGEKFARGVGGDFVLDDGLRGKFAAVAEANEIRLLMMEAVNIPEDPDRPGNVLKVDGPPRGYPRHVLPAPKEKGLNDLYNDVMRSNLAPTIEHMNKHPSLDPDSMDFGHTDRHWGEYNFGMGEAHERNPQRQAAVEANEIRILMMES